MNMIGMLRRWALNIVIEVLNGASNRFFINRLLTALARQTLTDADIFPPRLAESKAAIPLKRDTNGAFAWAGRPSKKIYIVCVFSAHVCGKNVYCSFQPRGSTAYVSK